MLPLNVAELVEKALIWDNHGCMPLRPEESTLKFLPLLQRYREGGVDVASLNVTFDIPGVDPLFGFRILSLYRRFILDNPEDYLLINTVDDIDRAQAENKLGVFFDIEGGVAIEPDARLIQAYYDLGVRWMLIAYNIPNKLGGGCQMPDEGLTEFGREVIDQMAETGMVLCCTHTGERTSLEAIEYSSNPVILSHSNPLGVHNHERNVSDDLLKAIGASGGVVNINGIGLFLGDNNDVSTETYVRHVNYVAELIGPGHVGIGLDYVFDASELDDFVKDNPDMFPPEKGYHQGIAMVEPERIPEIASALVASGWQEADLRGFLGENNLRVAKQVWK